MCKGWIAILMSLFLFCNSQNHQNLNHLRKLETENEIILLGFDNYTFSFEPKSMKFYTYFLLKNTSIDDRLTNFSFNIDTQITDEKSKQSTYVFSCIYKKDDNEDDFSDLPENYTGYKYECSNSTYNLRYPKKINITSNFTDSNFAGYINSTSPFVDAMKTNLVDLKDLEIFDHLRILKNSALVQHKGTYFKIKTDNKAKDSTLSENIQLILFSNNYKRYIKCRGYKGYDENEDEKLFLETTGINPEVNGKLQYSIANYTKKKGKYYMLDFGENAGNSTISPEPTLYKKKKGGLSTGGIIAILIPTILVLLGIAGLVYFLGNRTPIQPLPKVVNNNTIGVASSENIMNK